MYLFLCSQDLKSLTVGVLDGGQVHFLETLHSAPEQFLFDIDQQLKGRHVPLEQLEGVIVVTGPGSFTSSRLSVTIANAIAFRFDIPIIGVEHTQHLPVSELLQTIDLSKTAQFVQPTYDRPPHIT